MGSPNANSRIIERLNAIANQRTADGSTAAWVQELREDIEAFGTDFVALATYLAFRDFSNVFSGTGKDEAVIQTDQDAYHWLNEVPEHIKEDSGRVIRRMVLGSREVTYAVQRDDTGDIWEVKETLTETFGEGPRWSVTWVVPTVAEV